MNELKYFSRRELLAIAVGGTSLSAAAAGLAQTREWTASLVVGPFYPQIKPLDQDADLTLIKGQREWSKGEVIHIAGRVVNLKGEPVRNARIEVWQADANGRYSHPSDPNKAPLDRNFQGYCSLRSDRDGQYRFKTVKPGPYPGMRAGMRTPHIHLDIQAKTDRLVTQLFFPGEKLNETDVILQSVRNESARNTLFLKELPPSTGIGANETLFGWDCVLLTG